MNIKYVDSNGEEHANLRDALEADFDSHIVKRGLKSKDEINIARTSEGKKLIK